MRKTLAGCCLCRPPAGESADGPGRAARRLLAVLLAISAGMTLTATAGCGERPGGKGGGAGGDGDEPTAEYAAALAAADEFCDAWRRGDVSAGLPMLSGRIRRTVPDERISDVIAGGTNPVHVGYQIGPGRRNDDGSYSFTVRLFYRFTGRTAGRIEAPPGRIVLVRDADGQWVVDRFPLLEQARPVETIRVGP
ncbi:MAG: hypothetical protein J7M21_05055 [Planctomycetes bacterium]|nr:hypothetical protein [Planctomycetota bacterium]